jgi:tyrosine-protein phosphatase SIW14
MGVRSLSFCTTLLIRSLLSAQDASTIVRFEQVNDHLYRGGQPASDLFQALKKLGIKTVIDLRDSEHQYSAEKQEVESIGMRFISVPLTMHAPTDDEIAKILDLLENKSLWPVFLHCQGGRDRTSAVIACYRISHDGWSNQKAFAEAEQKGISKFDVGLRRYILRYRNPNAAQPLPVK